LIFSFTFAITVAGSGSVHRVGFVDIANGVGFLADRGSKRIDSDRTAVELVDYRGKDRDPLRVG
jgi:hypothetical protein